LKDPGGFTAVHSSKPEEKFSSSNVWAVTDETTVINVASANRRKLAVFILSVSVNIMLEKWSCLRIILMWLLTR
jgi:hypothetical protein